MRQMIEISVVICAYTEARWEELLAAVASVQAQSHPAREIIVVIDHNRALFERARAHFGSAVKMVENQQAQGLSGARNSGVAAAGGEVVAFMDEDAIAAPDWLEQLSVHYGEAQTLGVGGMIEPLWQASRPLWLPEEFYWVIGCSYRGLPEQTAPIRNLIGANMSFRRDALRSVGEFRHGLGRLKTIPLGCEETELSIRLGQRWPAGQLLYEPRARVQHRVPNARTGWRYFLARCYGEGRSKAQVAALVGRRDGLATERTYTFHTLPRGILRNVRAAVRQREPALLARAAAILVGLGVTGWGYLSAHLAAQLSRIRLTESRRFLWGKRPG